MEAPLEAWSEFNVAMLGGTAALVGLLIVAMSVNIKDILAAEPLPSRAAAAVATLTLALVVCALGLMPGQPLWAYGAETAVGTAILAVVVVRAVRSVYRSPGAPRGTRFPKALLLLAPVATYAAGAVLLLTGDGAGLAWLGAGAVLGVIAGAAFAWVVLIEVLR